MAGVDRMTIEEVVRKVLVDDHADVIRESVRWVALRALHELAHAGPLHHRVKLPDVLISACAQEAGVGVIHYDRDFDRLAGVLAFESRWLAPPGALD
ncbi:MAG: hypothetical protein M3071_06520 [Actinomycetota bacterium]|nr:hypothetical protein [Actinomycetota bacterium]